MKFNNIIKIYEETIFKPASIEDIEERKQEYALNYINKILKNKGHQNPDGSWDVKGNVDISDIGLSSIPVKFNKVNGYFRCSNNNLTSLEGCPEIVEGHFDCRFNNLTSLKACPKIVKYSFACSYNKLSSLEGCPEIVGGNFYCNDNIIEFTEEDIEKHSKVEGFIYT